jgi:hypothetical protein
MRGLESRKNQTKSVDALIVQRLESEGLEYVFFGNFDIGQIRGTRHFASVSCLDTKSRAAHSGAELADFYTPLNSSKKILVRLENRGMRSA